MRLLAHIELEPVTPEELKTFRKRAAVRAIVFDSERNIALLHVQKHNYHKLPGGGIEDEENTKTALKRECREEIGCDIKIGKELGLITEYKKQFKKNQTSICYLAQVIEEKGEPEFTEKELLEEFKVVWLPIEKAIETLKSDKPNDYQGKFVQKRDLAFLQEAIKVATKQKIQ